MSIIPIIPRWRAIRHKAYVRGFSGIAPYYLVNEFPKSGGTWLAQLLSQALDLPFRRNAPIQLERSVTHGHFLNPIGLRNVVVLWRDPRDLLVSFYYHCYFVNEHNNHELVRIMKVRCPFTDYNDIVGNLPHFIRFQNESPISPSFSWPQFAKVWARRAGPIRTSYEALRANTSEELIRITYLLSGTMLDRAKADTIVENNSFKNAKAIAHEKKSANIEMSFIREGSLGGWKKYFSPEAHQEMVKYHNAMSTLGYLEKS